MRRRRAARRPRPAASPRAAATRCRAAGSRPTRSIKRIGVPLFKDRTGKLGLDARVTAAVIDGAAEARALHGGQGDGGRRRGRRGRDHRAATVRPGRASPADGRTDVQQASRYAIAIVGERRLPQDRPEGAALVERRVLAARRVRHGRQPAELLRPRGPVDRRACPRSSPAASWPRCSRRSSRVATRARPRARRASSVVLGEDTYLAEEALERILAQAVGDERNDAAHGPLRATR